MVVAQHKVVSIHYKGVDDDTNNEPKNVNYTIKGYRKPTFGKPIKLDAEDLKRDYAKRKELHNEYYIKKKGGNNKK